MKKYTIFGLSESTSLICDTATNFHAEILTQYISAIFTATLPSIEGGVKLDDIAQLAETNVDGFFVVSAVANAENPFDAASQLVKT